MGRLSTKENKTQFQLSREEMWLQREAASEQLGWISPERIEKIENEKSLPHPDEVLAMSDVYKTPRLCNHYCANLCPIGQQYVPEVRVKDLSQIVLEMLASLNKMRNTQECLIEITADGQITEDEIADFVHIQNELEQMMSVVKMKGDKNTENKRFIVTMAGFGLIALVVTVGVLTTALGGNVKIDTDSVKEAQ